jgi:hypothetical protein
MKNWRNKELYKKLANEGNLIAFISFVREGIGVVIEEIITYKGHVYSVERTYTGKVLKIEKFGERGKK